MSLRRPGISRSINAPFEICPAVATLTVTLSACPAMAVPCGFDQFGRPVGLQLVGKPRGEAALLQAAALFEQLLGLDRLLPIEPRPGSVPPDA